MTVPYAQIRNALRRLWQWHHSNKVRSRARVKRGCYRCEKCGRHVGKVEVDHLVAVGPTPGSRLGKETSWDDFMARLFCAPEGLQVICVPCHLEKR